MTKDEALKMCLEYIETDAHERKYVRHAIKKALAQVEHIGFMDSKLNPIQRKPLTDEEIGAIMEDLNAYGTRLYTFARAIEAAHGIKGEA